MHRKEGNELLAFESEWRLRKGELEKEIQLARADGDEVRRSELQQTLSGEWAAANERRKQLQAQSRYRSEQKANRKEAAERKREEAEQSRLRAEELERNRPKTKRELEIQELHRRDAERRKQAHEEWQAKVAAEKADPNNFTPQKLKAERAADRAERARLRAIRLRQRGMPNKSADDEDPTSGESPDEN